MGAQPAEDAGRGRSRPLPAARLLRLALVFYGVLTALAFGWRRGVVGKDLVVAEGAAIHWARDPLLGVAAAGAVIVASQLFTERTRRGRALADALAAALGPLATWHCLVLAVASGVGEETFFRGALQPHLGLLWTSAIFALAHLVPRRDLLPWCGFSFAAGLLLGGLYEATGNLVAPVVAHAGINAVNLRRLARRAPP